MYQTITPIKMYVKNNNNNNKIAPIEIYVKKQTNKIQTNLICSRQTTIYMFVSASILKIGFQALINSLVCWFCTSALGLVLFQNTAVEPC